MAGLTPRSHDPKERNLGDVGEAKVAQHVLRASLGKRETFQMPVLRNVIFQLCSPRTGNFNARVLWCLI